MTFSTAEVSDISPLKALPHLQSLTIGGMAQKRTLADLSPLKGLKLTKLAIHSTAVSDLTPLAGMPLASLQMSNTRVTDLAPLKGAPLAWLSCVDSPVKDLAPLAGAPLATLWCGGSQVTDLSPLKTVPLKELSCDFQPERDKVALWAIKTLENINGKSAADFWKAVGPPEDPWFKQVAGLPAEQQLAAVMAKLKELNPGFDGKETHQVTRTLLSATSPASSATEADKSVRVTELAFSSVAVTNIVPVRTLTGLKKLTLLPWTKGGKSALADLSPLQGLPLTFLACGNSQVSDLTSLKGMPLTILSVDNTPVSDLTPLAGMPLTILWCNGTKVTDLSPLAGMLLQELKCDVKPEHAPLLASIPTLRKINGVAPAALWMRMGIKPPVAVGRVPSPGAGSAPSPTTTTPGQGTGPTFKPGAPAQTGQPFVTSTGMELLYIPPGEFMMGSTKEEQAWALSNYCKEFQVKREGEQPRKAMIKQGFWMGKTEVTVGQWKQFANATGYITDGEKKGESVTGSWVLIKNANWKDPKFGFRLKDNHPVSCISWNDAVAFCAWMNERELKAGRLPLGYKVRLPTEAEWEYACRAGRQTKFWWGESTEDAKNRLNRSSQEDGFEFVSPVDHYGVHGRNRFGLADMLGNVWEWCLDEYDEAQAHGEYYKGNPDTRPLRGGSFFPGISLNRCAVRHGVSRSGSHCDAGFRVAVGPEPSASTSPSNPTSTDATQKPPAGNVGGASVPRPSATTTPQSRGTEAPPTFKPGAPAQTGQPFVTTTGMELCYIPPGEFMMGSTPEERAWAVAQQLQEEVVRREGAQRRKTVIKQGFWLGKTEVTVGQWKQFAASTSYRTSAERQGVAYVLAENTAAVEKEGASWLDPNFGFKLKDSHPVSCISWNDAVAFCEWLNEREQKSGRLPPGYKVRLPTEAEWEYACRAGKQTKFWWGDTTDGAEGRLNWNGTADGFKLVSPVDHYGARGRNKFGLADMLGNVQEWCLDEYDPNGPHDEPYKGNPGARVMRGGAFGHFPAVTRCAQRNRFGPDSASSFLGFRVAVGPDR